MPIRVGLEAFFIKFAYTGESSSAPKPFMCHVEVEVLKEMYDV